MLLLPHSHQKENNNNKNNKEIADSLQFKEQKALKK